LAAAGAVFGLGLSVAAILVVQNPALLLDAEWEYGGRPRRISTGTLSSLVGNREVAERLEERVAPGEFVTTNAYSDVHLWAFLTDGRLQTRLAHISGGSHGLASLYWHSPDELRGRNALFASEREGLKPKLDELFEEVIEEEPVEVWRGDRKVRDFRVYRCRNLLHPEGAFTRLQ
jgi:hypothetical protein